MTRIADISTSIENWAPKESAQNYDNVGLLVGNPNSEVENCLVSLDLTPEVLAEAIEKHCQLIVSHHPIIFKALFRITSENYVSNLVLEAAKHGIGIYAGHTNVDAAENGVSFKLGSQFGLQSLEFLTPLSETSIDSGNYQNMGMGCVGNLAEAMAQDDFLDFVKDSLSLSHLRYAGGRRENEIQRVAVCGGSGSGLASQAKKMGADALITADITYHSYFEVFNAQGETDLVLVDVGHYESERETEQLFIDLLGETHSQVNFIRTSVNTNPVRYR